MILIMTFLQIDKIIIYESLQHYFYHHEGTILFLELASLKFKPGEKAVISLANTLPPPCFVQSNHFQSLIISCPLVTKGEQIEPDQLT